MRRRAGIALATVGVCAAVPLGIVVAQTATQPAATTVTEQAQTPGGLAPGETVPTDKTLPKILRDELAKHDGPVVAGFVLPGVNEDDRVTEWLNALRSDPKFKDTSVLIYKITPQSRLKDIPDVLDITSTPVVAVFEKNGKIAATWRGIVDKEMLAQSVIDARTNTPRPLKLTPTKRGPFGDKAGIALAKKVNKQYAKIPLIVETGKGVTRFPTDDLTYENAYESTHVLRKGLLVGSRQLGTTADGEKYDAITNRKGFFVKRESMNCWIHPALVPNDIINQPLLPLQLYRFGKPAKVKKTPGQLRMKIWIHGSSLPAWVAKIDAKTSAIISMKRDTQTFTIGDTIKPGSSTVAPATTGTTATAKSSAKTTAKASTKTASNPMASWPQTVPTCAEAG
jgi:hypothetical protein